MQKLRDYARTSEQHDPRIRADERSGHRAKKRRNEQNLPPLQLIEREEIRKRNAQQQRNHRDRAGNLEAVENRGVVILL